MIKFKKVLLTILISIPGVTFSQTSLRLPAILSDHMLLQQNAEVKLWGWADPRTDIKILPEWSKDTIRVTANEKAKWETALKTPKSGGPYIIQVFTKDKSIKINDVLIGELWLCGGQSNMEYSAAKGVIDAKEELSKSQNNKIRFFFIDKATADYPQDDLKGYWKVCTPESMNQFSAVGYFFGKALFDKLKQPIGLINSNWGGTPVETWTPKDKIDDVDKMKRLAVGLKESSGWDNTISSTYNAMINPLKNIKMAGVIWYQGEANCSNAYNYSNYFSNMIQYWREEFKTNLPFYYVQIAPYLRYPIPFSAAIVREQQEKTLQVSNTGMVVISDLVENINDIHPKYKKQVGYRLANYALAETYQQPTPKYRFATYRNATLEKDKIRVYFSDATDGLVVKGNQVEGLEIAGKDNKFYKANGKIDAKTNTLIVDAKQVKEPVYVRYAFGNGIIGNLFDKSGLPVSPFRTDNVIYTLIQN